jgi:hypothetical protein
MPLPKPRLRSPGTHQSNSYCTCGLQRSPPCKMVASPSRNRALKVHYKVDFSWEKRADKRPWPLPRARSPGAGCWPGPPSMTTFLI